MELDKCDLDVGWFMGRIVEENVRFIRYSLCYIANDDVESLRDPENYPRTTAMRNAILEARKEAKNG